MSDDIVRVQGWLASDGPLTGHDFRLPTEALANLAEQVRGRKIPMQFDHDDRRRVEARIITAEVREVRPGQTGVWVEYEVPEEFATSRRGFSIAFSRAIGSAGNNGGVRIQLAADVLNFGEEMTRAAAERISTAVDVDIALLYQLETVPPAKVVIVVARAALAQLARATAALVDGLRLFLRAEPSEFRFDIVDDGDRVLALLKTDDAETLTRAVRALPTVGVDAPVVEFDATTGSFVAAIGG